MSRGPGRIWRAIRRLLDDEPEGAFTLEDLAERIYHGVNRVEKKHRVSLRRALQKIVADDPNWRLWRAERTGKPLVLLNCGNVRSYALGRLKLDYLWAYRDRRRIGTWMDWRVSGERELRAMLAPGGEQAAAIQPGGAWHEHVELHVAERDGDIEKAAALRAEEEAGRRAFQEGLEALAPRMRRRPRHRGRVKFCAADGCGATFTSSRRDARFCSEACRRQQYRAQLARLKKLAPDLAALHEEGKFTFAEAMAALRARERLRSFTEGKSRAQAAASENAAPAAGPAMIRAICHGGAVENSRSRRSRRTKVRR